MLKNVIQFFGSSHDEENKKQKTGEFRQNYNWFGLTST